MNRVLKLFDLTGKKALITGGSRGLGFQAAEALGSMGAEIVIVSRKEKDLKEATSQLTDMGIKVNYVSADLQSEKAMPSLVDDALKHMGGIDILINNAGATWGAPAEDHSAEAWHKIMNLNINGMFFLSQEVGKRCMIPNNYGKIINVSSIAGLRGNPKQMKTIAYNTSKGAVMNYTRALAAEWGPYNINVNTICPGFFHTKMTKGLLAVIEKSVIAQTPLGRLGDEDDMKGTFIYLSSDASKHVTGEYIAVDGGFAIC